MGKTILLGTLLFGMLYLLEFTTERLLMTDFRFIFPMASDLTAARALLFPRYFPFIFVGFLQMGLLLHIQLTPGVRETRRRTFIHSTLVGWGIYVLPIVLLLLVQYVPLFVNGTVPFVGPGNSATSFIINLFPVLFMLLFAVPLSTWCHQLTGRPYLGAVINSLIVTWMFTSSQVIAPVPL